MRIVFSRYSCRVALDDVVIIHYVKWCVVAMVFCHRNAMIIYSRDDGCRGGIKSLESGSKNQMYAL
ncbi:hypothetical protein DF214_16785 [Pectobacterium atrosepticum]|nr:hypothetical protein CVS35_05800 [Pectobacterium atrosepticum]KFX16815.1 hypothetical protein JV34_02860 [Pectobacterium atrosepticum]KFX25097.1 hypothetical protein KP24_08600 [Pectobacterium atrosepticum]PWD56152.1 hypothetical protein DF214_16785 [Pectobacterium atrosepticum]